MVHPIIRFILAPGRKDVLHHLRREVRLGDNIREEIELPLVAQSAQVRRCRQRSVVIKRRVILIERLANDKHYTRRAEGTSVHLSSFDSGYQGLVFAHRHHRIGYTIRKAYSRRSKARQVALVIKLRHRIERKTADELDMRTFAPHSGPQSADTEKSNQDFTHFIRQRRPKHCGSFGKQDSHHAASERNPQSRHRP